MLDRWPIGQPYRPIFKELANRENGLSVERTGEAREMPTKYGDWQIISYRDKEDNEEHAAIVKGDITTPEPVLTRMHSSCLTSEVFEAINCDCAEQMDKAMERIAGEGRGVIVYLHQEGRGNGLVGKLLQFRAMAEQDLDTVEACRVTGQKLENRNYKVGADIYKDLGITAPLRLMTHNPDKIGGLEQAGFKVIPDHFQVNINSPMTQRNLEAKKRELGHIYP